MKSNILKYALIGAAITAGWIAAIVTVIFNAESLFGKVPENSMLAPIAMLMLFVVSAAITSMGVFGRPLMWYLDGKKKEAVELAISTISVLVIILLILGGILVL